MCQYKLLIGATIKKKNLMTISVCRERNIKHVIFKFKHTGSFICNTVMQIALFILPQQITKRT